MSPHPAANVSPGRTGILATISTGATSPFESDAHRAVCKKHTSICSFDPGQQNEFRYVASSYCSLVYVRDKRLDRLLRRSTGDSHELHTIASLEAAAGFK